MTSIGAVTRQISGMNLSDQKPCPSSSSTNRHPVIKQPSQQHLTKLLTKHAAPKPFANATNKKDGSQLRETQQRAPTQPSTSSKYEANDQLALDIGCYDGGLELDNEKRGERIYGDAAEELALDSSVSKYVICLLELVWYSICTQEISNTSMEFA